MEKYFTYIFYMSVMSYVFAKYYIKPQKLYIVAII